jgi:hypothetical protein
VIETVQMTVKWYHNWKKNFTQQEELVKVLKFQWLFQRASQLEKAEKSSKPKLHGLDYQEFNGLEQNITKPKSKTRQIAASCMSWNGKEILCTWQNQQDCARDKRLYFC